ncbi:MAG: phosphate ABC transporter substrate-binding protein [Methanocorpusculum sp.]|nr:phosphate ABC transporter substrate-binding protein [Methanocorpusculum sp.]
MTTRKNHILGGFALVILLLTAVFGAGCISTEDTETISIAGSTTVLPVAQAAAEEYMNQNSNADIQVSGGGSGVGATSVIGGTSDIGMLSRDLKASEKEGNTLKEFVVGKDGIALVGHPSNTVSDLSLEQVKAIYQGEITNWNEVGGADLKIVLIGRDSSSGTREFFTEFVLDKEDAAKDMQELNSNGAVAQAVSITPGAIGYVSLEYVDDSLKAFSIGGVAPTVDNVISGVYEINRPLLMVTNGEPEGLAADYLAFILSEEGQQILKDSGFIPAVE